MRRGHAQGHVHPEAGGAVARWKVYTPTFGRWQAVGDGAAEEGRA